tara:strand:- start:72594 stop:75365 length:2772 start_codon:yes stop_codon:yes gene_type:complete
MLFLILMVSCTLNRFNPGSKGIIEDIDKVIQSPSQENAEVVLSKLYSKQPYKVYEKLIDTGDSGFFNRIPKDFLRHGLLLKIRKNRSKELERMFLDKIGATKLERSVAEGKIDEINDESKEWLINNYKYREEAVSTADILFIYEKEELVKKLLDKLKEEKKDLGNQILLSASKVGNFGLVKHLLEMNFVTNMSDGFLLAAENGNVEICKFLIDKGIDVNVVNKRAACESNSSIRLRYDDNKWESGLIDIFHAPISGGCEVLYKWEKGSTALGYAAQNGHKNICQLLLEKGSDVNMKDREGMTALIYAAKNGYLDLCKFLIDKGADVNTKIIKEKKGEKETSIWSTQCTERVYKKESGSTALICAAGNGYLEVCKLLLERGAEVDAQINWNTSESYLRENDGRYSGKPRIEKTDEEKGLTALICAAMNGYLEVCNLLLDRGASIHANVEKKLTEERTDPACIFTNHPPFQGERDAKDPDFSEIRYEARGASALIYAAYNGHKEVCEMLLERGSCNSDIVREKFKYSGNDAIITAMGDEEPPMDVYQQKELRSTALIYAAQNGKREMCKYLLKRVEEKEKEVISEHPYILLEELEKENIDKEFCEMLLKAGVSDSHDFKSNALRIALENKSVNKDICELLIDNGADINSVSGNNRMMQGLTPLVYAAFRGCREIIELLIEKGVDVNAGSKVFIHGEEEFLTTLMHLSFGGVNELDTYRLLIEKGADVNFVNNKGRTALIYALMGIDYCRPLREEVCRLLLDNSENPNTRDINGKTALMYAAQGGHREICELLLQRGASISDEDINGKTILMYAAQGGYREICELLLQRGASISDKDINKKTILMYAAESSNKETTEFIIESTVKRLVEEGEEFDEYTEVQTENLKCMLSNMDVKVGELQIENESLLTFLFQKQRIDLIQFLSGLQ